MVVVPAPGDGASPVAVVESPPPADVPCSFHQTDDAVTLIIDVPGIVPGSVELDFTAHAFGPIVTHSCIITFETTVDGFAGISQLIARFDAAIKTEECTTDVSDDNAVIVISKVEPTPWRRLRTGSSASDLKERMFPTVANLSSLAATPEAESDGAAVGATLVSQSESSYAVDVTVGLAASRQVSFADDTTTPHFIPSPEFTGSKTGYVFRAGDEGTGYYTDSVRSARAGPDPEANAKAAAELIEKKREAEQEAMESRAIAEAMMGAMPGLSAATEMGMPGIANMFSKPIHDVDIDEDDAPVGGAKFQEEVETDLSVIEQTRLDMYADATEKLKAEKSDTEASKQADAEEVAASRATGASILRNDFIDDLE